MTVIAPTLENLTLEIKEQTRIKSSIATVFASLLEEIGPANVNHDGTPMPLVLEPWPGGRWFRDLGAGAGHLWGHVQAIKAPTLLEVSGPLMMSFAVANNVQYRLTPKDGGTQITLRHTAIGLFPDGYREQVGQGWTLVLGRVRQRVESPVSDR